jgi:hypothetical protein
MDFNNHYCKHCGRKVKEIMVDGPRIFNCECQKEPLNRDEVIAGFTREARITQLKAMHDLMCEANDEGIYMTWIYRMPDCPSEEDFIDVAMDDEQYNECFDLFVKLITRDGNRY